MCRLISRRHGALALLGFSLGLLAPWAAVAQDANAVNAEISRRVQSATPPAMMFKVHEANENLQLMVNESKILSLDEAIPTAQVNNPELLELTAISPTQVQVFPKKPGVTQVNLWTDEGSVHTINVHIVPDARELEFILQKQFPNAVLRVTPLASSVVIRGRVDDPNEVGRIVEIAQDYHPKVHNLITVGGVQQVLLHVKAMEVSRTKLRDMGIDWANINGGDMVASGAAGVIGAIDGTGGIGVGGGVGTVANIPSGAPGTFSFSIVNGGNAFFSFLRMLQQRDLAKLLSEPTLVTVSGRPAYFNVGGEVPVPASGLGAATVQFRPFGTQVDFVPIILGNGRVRLEVRPRVSELDTSINVNGIPGFKVRVVDTAVEMNCGQTLALAGLVQTRIEASVQGLPWLSDVPYLGAAFRRTREKSNETELLVLVTPQLAEAMNSEEVPCGGPGHGTGSPTDVQLYMKGHLEVPGHIRDGNCKTPQEDRTWDCYRCPPRYSQTGCESSECHIEDESVFPGQQMAPGYSGEELPPGPIGMEEARRQPSLQPVQTASPSRPTARTARGPMRPAPKMIGPSGYDTEK